MISVGLEGMRGHRVIVEANVRVDKESCVIVGLPDASMKESKERILSCLHKLDVDLAMKKVTIHLSPADKRKTGTGHDCAMLLAVLKEVMEEPIPVDPKTCFLAALSLSGDLVPFHGLIPSLQQAIRLGFERIILPPVDLSFLAIPAEVELIPIHSMVDLLAYLRGQLQLELTDKELITYQQVHTDESLTWTDFAVIRGHEDAKRVMEIAAAGGHHVLLNGPPGCGKTMLADAFHTILPNLKNEEMLETFGIYHLAKEERGFSERLPYRHPHHSASAVSLIGGGTFPRPGEISLAYNGVLFLDELGEFSRKSLDMLRQPMESGEVTINRVKQSVTYPASFILVAATNPCPCGYFGSNERYCTCTAKQIKAYQLKVSGPLLTRIDFNLTLRSVGLIESKTPESSNIIRKRVRQARYLQRKRYGAVGLNGNVHVSMLLDTALLSKEQELHFQSICCEEKWSNRTMVKLIRIARTISDLQGEDTITRDAINEAVKWKCLSSTVLGDRKEEVLDG
ncbi:YifB family Mg chelatase-like AAA ATPase [Sporosarcina sp. 179-K 3D1 HS]|uniref:YifB family Mg chelatase-like AAA ATPase n=1 Tax=Sporosarcina sp. 179-K 3D1 HS TaxID=3232169 RepID=UPI00399F1F31